MVSFNEYPTIVSKAAIIDILNSYCNNNKTLDVIAISCNKAMILPKAY